MELSARIAQGTVTAQIQMMIIFLGQKEVQICV